VKKKKEKEKEKEILGKREKRERKNQSINQFND